ncbi:hypothetical protein G5T42_13845 [Microbacterium sp. 4R-513]|uniref:hypothetical protein n=1 Tax=Microbacterium sp. 4R-513 TaxID=2567934 RepID=UPI0013E1751F|nr:hypothetical protein [Microbacterium sp. 4R-513]QIG40423.1 hypothetical protein G5T42_13845 [Microbacterium sp. 4R-513]
MTAPWLVRRSKTDEVVRLVALVAVGLHFVVATALACVAVSTVRQVLPCYLIACYVTGAGFAVSAFLVFDILLFLISWGLTAVMASKGWWRIAPPLAGIVIAIFSAAVVMYWWFASFV